MSIPKNSLKGEIASSFANSLASILEHQYVIERLIKDLRHFEGELDRQLETNLRIVDSHVRKLIADARSLLKLCQIDGKAGYVPYCLAAVDYLVNSNDAVTDFSDYDGFDDDREVIDSVINEFGLRDKLLGNAA
jgi:hypothetical protein